MLPFESNYLAYLLAHPQQQTSAEQILSNGTKIRLLGVGAIELEPATLTHSSRAIVLSAGIHGNETAPIEWLNQLLDDLLGEHLVISEPLLLLWGHPQAMIAGVREIGTNLNRLFNGAHKHGVQDLEHQRAAELEGWMDTFYRRYSFRCAHYDLHTAIRSSVHEKFAVVPYTPQRAPNLEQFALLQDCGVDCLLFFHQPTTTFSYHSAIHYDADAFTVELGKVRPFGQNERAALRLLDDRMRLLICGGKSQRQMPDVDRCRWYQVTDVINREQSDFRLNFADDLANFSTFQSGDCLAYQAEEPVLVDDGPKSVVFPNAHVQVGQRAAILVKQLAAAECARIIYG
ncbi:succinylglutamate desuccinylase [Celerinatantimonas sp. YJH-8]|uniref:succinylglutamate desuccinylase n=1 Tax=Celerinatantimonas sp. YJH-8 TaxID=3228714 RepID=UPI0038C7F8A4